MKKTKFPKPPEIEISYRYSRPISSYPKVTEPEHIYAVLNAIWNNESISHREEIVIVLLNKACRVLGYYRLGVGGIDHVTGDPKLIFQVALKANASAIIVAHNHPSGDLNPSKSDFLLAARLAEIGELLGIDILDNIIMTQESYRSYK